MSHGHTSDRQARSGAIGLAAATVACIATGLALGGGSLGGSGVADVQTPPATIIADAFQIVSVLCTTLVGAVLAVRRPANPIGWIFSWFALVTAAYLAAGGYAIHALEVPGSLPGGAWAAWLRNWTDRSATAFVLLAFLLFPTGQLASVRWRPALAVPPLVALGFATRAFVPGEMEFLGVANPAGIDWVPQFVADGALGGVPVAFGLLVVFAELVTRFRVAGRMERAQIKWLAVPAVAFFAALIATVLTLAFDLSIGGGARGPVIHSAYALVGLLLPVCMGIAILRYRLLDIDVVINRALVYAPTTGAIALAFFAAIVLLQALLRPLTGGSELAVAISTLGSVALFQPLRRRVQTAVDRRFYRSRYDAARTLDAFSVRLRDEVDLDAVRAALVAAARETVQPAQAGLWLRR